MSTFDNHGCPLTTKHVPTGARHTCQSCAFRHIREEHPQCPMRFACMSRYRPDRQSVYFSNAKNPRQRDT